MTLDRNIISIPRLVIARRGTRNGRYFDPLPDPKSAGQNSSSVAAAALIAKLPVALHQGRRRVIRANRRRERPLARGLSTR